MQPIDPTPFIAVYMVIFVMVPWLIYACCLVRECIYIVRSHPEFGFFSSGKQREYMRQVRDQDLTWKALHAVTLRWLAITIGSWVSSFVVLAVVMDYLGSHNLLIETP